MSEVRGSQEELPRVRGPGQRPGGDILSLRLGVAAEKSYPTSEVRGSQEELPRVRGQGAAARRRHPASEVRGGS